MTFRLGMAKSREKRSPYTRVNVQKLLRLMAVPIPQLASADAVAWLTSHAWEKSARTHGTAWVPRLDNNILNEFVGIKNLKFQDSMVKTISMLVELRQVYGLKGRPVFPLNRILNPIHSKSPLKRGPGHAYNIIMEPSGKQAEVIR